MDSTCALFLYSIITPAFAAGLCRWLSFLRDLWHETQGVVLLIGLGIVVSRLRYERLQLSERVETLSQIVRATWDEAEEAVAIRSGVQTAIAGRQSWEIIRSDWRNVRNRIELKIENIPQVRIRQKYSRMRRYRYAGVIEQLAEDRLIEPHVRDALLAMDGAFQQWKFRPADVKPPDVGQFREWLSTANGALPPLAESLTPADQAPGEVSAKAAVSETVLEPIPTIGLSTAPRHWSDRPILLRLGGGVVVICVMSIIDAMTQPGRALFQLVLATLRLPLGLP
jgi:hypothetical protein